MHDLRYALRLLAKNPLFTAIAVLVLAIAIGGNSAMFTLINALALKPIHARNPKQLVGCYSREKKPDGAYRGFSYPNYTDMRERNTVFSSLMAFTMTMVGLGDGENPRRTFAAVVSANYFSTFGVAPIQGRDFTADEERPGRAAAVAIASYSLWQKHGGAPGFIGQSIRVNNRPVQIIGIAPQYFTGTAALFSPELWLPLSMYEVLANDYMNVERRSLSDRNNSTLMVVGRLQPGLTLPKAQASLQSLAAQLESAYPEANKDQTFLVAALPRLSISTNPNRDQLGVLTIVLLGMSGVVLLIACLNLANMLLARGAARRKEIAIRTALGGARAQIIRQLLTEGLVLSLAGGAAGLGIAYGATQLLVSTLVPKLPFMAIEFPSSPDWRVVAATLGFCVVSTFLFGFGPAWKLSRIDINQDLKEQTGAASGDSSRHLMASRNLVVIGQIALSVALLTAAGLFIRGAMRAAQADPGFRMERGLLAEIDAALGGYDEAHGRQLYVAMLERLRAVPGIDSVALAFVVPFGVFSDGTTVRKWVQPDTAATAKLDPSDKPVGAQFNVITSDYFKTLGLGVLRGREFARFEAESLSGPPVALIDQVLAERLWPGTDPVGRSIKISTKRPGHDEEALQVVGVVPNLRNDLTEKAFGPHVYVPFGQYYRSHMNLHIKTSLGNYAAESALLRTIREEIRQVDAGLPLMGLQTLRDFRDDGLLLWFVRTGARLFMAFGAFALLLAMVGIYGLKSFLVAQRTHEIGIRMALGATRSRVVRMVLWESTRLTAVGLAIGLLLALGTGYLLASVLSDVPRVDPLMLCAGPLLLAVAALVACYLPARRAARIEPMAALRHE